MSNANRIILVDGSGFIFRAYHSLPPLTNPQGTPVGAVYGFIAMLLKLREQYSESPLVVVFDAARKSFRNAIYADYKAHRPPAPEDLIPQFALVREATKAMHLPAIEQDGLEADDIIATYATQAADAGKEVVIISSDKDLMQLLSEQIHMYDAMKNRPITYADVEQKFGVPPELVVEVQALMGDSSDNVPGVPGIGAKTAAQLILEFGSVENLLNNVQEIPQPKRRASLIDYAEQARISRQLVELKRDCNNLPPLPDMLESGNKQDLADFLHRHGFKALLKRLGASPLSNSASNPEIAAPASTSISHPPAPTRQYELVQDMETLQRYIAAASYAGYVAIDTETTGLDAMQADLVGISLCVQAGKACYIPLNHTEGDGAADMFNTGKKRVGNQLEQAQVLEALRPLLIAPDILKIGQNIKYDMQILQRYGVSITPYDDTMLLSCTLGAGAHAHNMDELAQRYLGITPIAFKDVVGSGRTQVTFDAVALDKACDYAAEDADITLQLWHILRSLLRNSKITRVYERLERPLVAVVQRMEAHGILVDAKQLGTMSAQFAQDMHTLEQEIHILAGRAFSIASPKQLGEVLFDELELDTGKRSSKTGAYTTDATTLEKLAEDGHIIAQKVLEWRQMAKLKSTYTDALARQIHPHTGRVHTSFSLASTSTGRLSSSEPNLQNIPIRSEAGRRIREAFIAAPNHVLLSADYSQIELRLLAHIADIPSLRQAFAEGADIHTATAAEMFDTHPDAVDSELRRRAKTINFGIIYGISAHGLATRLGIGRSEAADYIARYFARYPGIKDYMETTKTQARSQGYVETIYGRRCHIPGIHDKNANIRAFSERAAINAPLQGSAADIIKRAMLAVDRLLQQHPCSKLLLQVHDELIIETPQEHAALLAPRITQAMERVAQLRVPLVVETGQGKNWAQAH